MNKQKNVVKKMEIFDYINVVVLLIFTLLIVIPVWNVFASSFATNQALARGFIFWPSESTLQNYRRVLSDDSLGLAFVVSVLKTVIGVVTHVFFCAMVGYGMSKSHLLNRKVYTTMGIISMYFSGGMIPTYLLIRSLGMLNSFSVYIIPALLSYFDVIILLNFFRAVPSSLEESAKIDGAYDFKIFTSIYIPLSKPVFATIALFNGVWQWNDFMTARLYITNESLYPLQMKLFQVIVQAQLAQSQNINAAIEIMTTTRGVQLAMIVVSTVPILVIYPLLQKHFVSGMMLGAVKE